MPLVVGFVLREQGLARGIMRNHNLIAQLSDSPTIHLAQEVLYGGEVRRLDMRRGSRDI